jgi:hypothetical protein
LGSALASGTAAAGATAAATGPAAPIAATTAFIGAAGYALIRDAKESVKREFNSFTNSRNNLGKIIDAVNAGMDPLEGVQLYNQELTKIAVARAKLKLKTDNELSNFLGKPGDELQDVENFYVIEYAMYNNLLTEAISMPSPDKIFGNQQQSSFPEPESI